MGQKVEEKILDKKVEKINSKKRAFLALAGACLIGSTFIASNFSAVVVSDGNQKKTIISPKAASAVEIINRAGFELKEDDSYTVSSEDAIDKITILRSFDISVIDGGALNLVSVVDGTVEEALANSGIDLPDEDDVISCQLTDAVEEGMVITIDRVEYVTSTVKKSIAYKTITKNDKTLASGKTKVSVKGVDGTKEITTVKKVVNGQVVDTKTTEKVIKQAINQVVLKGTKAASSSVKTGGKYTVDPASKKLVINGKNVSYKKVLTGSGTAYTAPKGSLTSTGKKVKVGYVAVNPKIIPYGTKLYIASVDGKYVYGYAEAADTGSALRNGSALVDLFYNTEAECVKFGRRQVNVYILG